MDNSKVKEAIEWAKDEKRTAHERSKAREVARQFSWNKVAKAWNEELKDA